MTLTMSELLDDVRGAASAGTKRVYSTYWNLLEKGFIVDGSRVLAFGPIELDKVRASQIQRGSRLAAEQAIRRRGHRQGASATEHYISAARMLWAIAVKDGVTTKNPALEVAKPKKAESRRHALSPEQLQDLWRVTAETGQDPALDILLLRFHLETGARREGALNLTRADIHTARQTVTLREKGGTDREQPITLTLQNALLAHYEARAPKDRDEPVFRYLNGTALTRRRYNSIFERVQKHLTWAGEIGVSIHWLRHTAISHCERVSSYAVAQKFAGHRPAGVTGTYSKATVTEVAQAVAAMTGEPHPLAPAPLDELPW